MNLLRMLLLSAAIVTPAVPALAADAGAAPSGSLRSSLPSVLNPSERSNYREVFAAIDAADWPAAAARLAGMQDGPLHAAATAELYLAKGSPVVTLEQITALLERAPYLPQAAQLGRLAEKRGATELPELPVLRDLRWAGSQPRRRRAEGVAKDPIAADLEAKIQPLIVNDQPASAETLLNQQYVMLTPEARTEFQQRIAWAYYLAGNDHSARRLADMARGGPGDWGLQATWVSGLAAWRMNDCNAAANAFASVAARSSDPELSAAGHYWAARADTKCARPENVQARLRSAAALKETFYGLLAARALGIRARDFPGLHNFRDAEWHAISGEPAVRTAIGLVEIGETALADQFIRHQARIGGREDHAALLHLAADLNLASTQYWLAHNAPRGTQVNMAARYPTPDWQPSRGWRVDRSLAFAHALQESSFRTSVVSPAGARGLMQVRPGTAGDIARSRGEPFTSDQLAVPSVNLEYGQSYLEYLRSHYGTGGLLPKVIAAYNAGPAPIAEWSSRRVGEGDPLLFIESIPYWETRGYVPIVFRNYWIYQEKSGAESVSREALAQGLWPRFPGLPGATAVRLDGPGSLAGSKGSD